MVIVPVTPLGRGLTVGAAPTCRPFAPTGTPGSVPSEEVTPSDGMTVPTWAHAGLKHSTGKAAATINDGLMEDLQYKKGLRNGRPRGPAVTKATVAADIG